MSEQCFCVVLNRDAGETQRNWFKRWMCMHHWMQTDYYRAKIHDFDGDGICKNCGIEEAIAGQECKVAKEQTDRPRGSAIGE
jgi:hypothetical protein